MQGCSRVPVYSGSRTNIVGLLFVKDLILVDAADGLEVSTIMTFRGRPVQRVFEDVTLDKVLQAFLGASSQHAHMVGGGRWGCLAGRGSGAVPGRGRGANARTRKESVGQCICGYAVAAKALRVAATCSG